MERHSGEYLATLSSEPASSDPTGLLLSRDLIFTSKITSTAATLGYLIKVAGTNSQAMSIIGLDRPRVVFVDLTAGDLTSPTALIGYLEVAGVDTWFVAFGSHVDVDLLAAATTAGCHAVLPRSRFSATLPELITQYFSQPAARNV